MGAGNLLVQEIIKGTAFCGTIEKCEERIVSPLS